MTEPNETEAVHPARVRRTPEEYVARARQRMLDEGDDPDQPVHACEPANPERER